MQEPLEVNHTLVLQHQRDQQVKKVGVLTVYVHVRSSTVDREIFVVNKDLWLPQTTNILDTKIYFTTNNSVMSMTAHFHTAAMRLFCATAPLRYLDGVPDSRGTLRLYQYRHRR